MPKTCPVCGKEYADSIAFCPDDGSTLKGKHPTDDLVGSVIADRYRVERLLGEGGMGQVYLARHVRLPQQAAIKVMHTATAHDDGAVARFNREAANAARIEHERVARVFDFGEWGDGVVYLAMEYVPGRTLRSLLEEDGRLPPARAANIVYQVAEGLDAAHRLGIVHRDLKPDNVMVVTDEHGVDRCKVVDFGIAKATDASSTRLTGTGMIVGTPEFMSPEQIVGDPVDARSDVYSLALVAFQMFAGSVPFMGATFERILMARLTQEAATLSAVAPGDDWPEALHAAFTRALHADTVSRTATAMEFAEAVVVAVEEWTGAPVLRGRTPMGIASVSTRALTPSGSSAPLIASSAPPGVSNTPPGVSSATPSTSSAAPGATAGTSTTVPPRATAGVPPGATVEPGTPPESMRGDQRAPEPSGESRPPAASSTPGAARLAAAVVGVVVLGAVSWSIFSAMRSGRDPVAVATQAASPAGAEAAAVPPAAPPGDAKNSLASSATPPRAAAATDADRRSTTDSANADAKARPSSTPVPATPEPPAAPVVAAPRADAAGASAARRQLDSVRAVLASSESGEAEARAAVSRIQQLLGSLASASDSTWAYLALVSALGQSGEAQRACGFLRSAQRLAATDAQLRAVRNYFASEALACVP